MATTIEDQPEGALEPPTEEVHLPDPSYTPVLVALGISIMVIGIIMSWVIVAIGAIIFLASLLRWVGQTRHEMSQLPLGH